MSNTRRPFHRTRNRLSIAAASLFLMALGGLGGGCQNNKTNDELGRLTAEREQLLEDVSKARSQQDNLRYALAQPVAQPPVQEAPTTPRRSTDPDFGEDTTTSRRGGDLVVEVAGDVLFDSGSTILKSTSRKTLDRVARIILDKYAGNQVRVEGYTDSDPIRKQKDKYDSNEALSAARALAVEKYLVSRGLSSDMVYAAAFGPASPKSTKKASRRVEIVILSAR